MRCPSLLCWFRRWDSGPDTCVLRLRSFLYSWAWPRLWSGLVLCAFVLCAARTSRYIPLPSRPACSFPIAGCLLVCGFLLSVVFVFPCPCPCASCRCVSCRCASCRCACPSFVLCAFPAHPHCSLPQSSSSSSVIQFVFAFLQLSGDLVVISVGDVPVSTCDAGTRYHQVTSQASLVCGTPLVITE